MSLLNVYASLLLIILINNTSNTFSCSSFQDCFNCSSFEENGETCLWKNNKCTSSIETIFFTNWFETFLECENDHNSLQYQLTFCTNINITSIPFQAKLNEINGKFGTYNTFCLWDIKQVNIDKMVKITLRKKENDSSSCDQYALQVKFTDNTEQIVLIDNDTYDVNLKKVVRIIFRYYGKEMKQEQPFYLEAFYNDDDDNETINDNTLLIIIGLCAIALIIIVVVIICLCRRKNLNAEKFNNCSNTITTNNTMMSHSVRNNCKENNNRVMITTTRSCAEKTIINEDYNYKNKCVTYNEKVSDYNIFNKFYIDSPYEQGNCDLCYEIFTITDKKIVRFKCLHTFHNECICNWYSKVIKSRDKNDASCPKCDISIFGKKREKEILHLKDNKDKNNNCVYNKQNESIHSAPIEI